MYFRVPISIVLLLLVPFLQPTNLAGQEQAADRNTTYATLLGGDGYDLVTSVAFDASGATYLTGLTSSSNFPAVGQQFRPRTSGPTEDVFVAKIDPTGSRLEYSLVIGGMSWEFGADIAVDRTGAAYVVGTTASRDFPLTPPGVSPSGGGSTDGFLLKINPAGQLEFSTMIGGTYYDYALDVAIGCGDHAYVSGSTQSEDFPVGNRESIPFTGNMNFIVRFDPETLRMVPATWFGSGEIEGLACDAAGHAYASGYTGYIPVVNAFQENYGGNGDAFLIKTDTRGEALLFGTYIGGAGSDRGRDVMLGPDGSIYVVGTTQSADFPVTGNSPRHQGQFDDDAFVARLTNTGSLVYSTVVPTALYEEALRLDVDRLGRAWVTTRSYSLSSIAVFSSTGALERRYNTPFSDQGLAIARAPSGDLWIAGTTARTNLPVTPGAVQANFGGYFDGFLVGMTFDDYSSDIVLHARDARAVTGNWQLVPDPTAATGTRIWNPDRTVPKITMPSATPSSFFELTFQAEAGVAYHMWLRLRADGDSWANDSLYAQFSDAVNFTGSPIWPIGTTKASAVSLEDCVGCGERGWGWNDNGYDAPGQLVMFATSGTHTLRIQQREDGISVDQVVLSSRRYLRNSPGHRMDDATILPATAGSTAPSDPREIVMYVAQEFLPGGENWFVTRDSSAIGGLRLFNPDRGVPKPASATAAYLDYFEIRFSAQAGLPYHLWVRGKAQDDHYYNDSVFIQFSDSVDVYGSPIFRIGTNSTNVILEDCSGCREQGWGWQDNAYGQFASPIYFSKTGPQTIRVIRREDGLSIDQIVLSAGKYLNASPGALKNDATIVPK